MYFSLLVFLLICYGAAAIGGLLTRPGLPWLKTLHKPSFNPPNWLFGPVWTVLYGLMAVSGWWVYTSPAAPEREQLLWIFAGQLALNTLWSGLFFALRKPGWALLDILPLLLLIWLYILRAAPLAPVAAWLLVPYGLWVGFATALNGALWWLNRVPSRPTPQPPVADAVDPKTPQP